MRVDGRGVTTDVLALSFLYMKISAALEESLAQSDVTLYSRNDSWSQIWRVKSCSIESLPKGSVCCKTDWTGYIKITTRTLLLGNITMAQYQDVFYEFNCYILFHSLHKTEETWSKYTRAYMSAGAHRSNKVWKD